MGLLLSRVGEFGGGLLPMVGIAPVRAAFLFPDLIGAFANATLEIVIHLRCPPDAETTWLTSQCVRAREAPAGS